MPKKIVSIINTELIEDGGPAGLDMMRRKIGGQWEASDLSGYSYRRTLQLAERSPGTMTTPFNEDEDSIKLENISIDERTGIPTIDTKSVQTITISQKKAFDGLDSSNEEWDSIVRNLVPIQIISSEDGVTGMHIDLATSLEMPPTTEEALAMEGDYAGTEAGVDYVYNYLDTEYEGLLSIVMNHNVIPSMNEMLQETYNTDTNENTLKAPTKFQLQRNIREDSGILNLRAKFENQLVPMENNEALRDYTGNKYLFPMYTQINIPLDSNNEIATALDDSKMSCCLSRDMHGGVAYTTPDSISAETYSYSYTYYDNTGSKIVDTFNVPAVSVDLMSWLDGAGSWGHAYELPQNWMYVGHTTDLLLAAATPSSTQVADNVTHHVLADGIPDLKNRLRQLTSFNRRSYRDLLDGDEAYSETLMYKVVKYLGDNIDAPLQTFYFTNSAELIEFADAERKLELVDTQVKYGQEYTYSVLAYQAILGTKYRYLNVATYNPNDDATLSATEGFENNRWATFDVEIDSLIRIVETPLFMSIGKILDNPPLSPEIKFNPYKGQTDKLMMLLSTNTGMIDATPITFTAEEAEDMAQVSFNQRRLDDMITFKTDDPNTSFQIYRVDVPPNQYQDFANSLYTTIDTSSTDPTINLQAGSAPALVKQTTNKKYYYMFRAIDYHGGLSNPSPVFEIELYNDGGVGYPIIKHYEFGQISPKTPVKSARKMIQIVPRITQAYVNETASGLVNGDGSLGNAIRNTGIVLGIEDEPLFGKKFKIRLTSKSTGKKVDINVDFKTKRVLGAIE